MEGYITIDADEYLGAIKLKGKWYVFYELRGMWVLNHRTYHPSFQSEQYPDWRPGLLVVNRENADEFINHLREQEKELSIEELPRVRTAGFEGLGLPELTFVIDFDEQLFVSAFPENLAIHEHVPEGWKGIEDAPLEYVPPELKKIWDTSE